MLQVITSLDEVKKCQKRLRGTLASMLKHKGTYNIGYQGGNFDKEIYFDSQLWFSGDRVTDGGNRRYWNAFGTELVKHGSNKIAVEVNVPLSGVNRRLSGLFAKDTTTQDAFLLHRGRIGGGRKGIGKDAFMAWYRGGRTEIDEGHGEVETAILVTALGAPSFLDNLSFFVHKVALFKRLIAAGDNAPDLGISDGTKTLSFTPEFSGTKKGRRASSFVAECSHGRVVDALESYLRRRHQSGALVFFNNQLVDLGMTNDGKLGSIYEVKTNTDRQSVYGGIGQLMFHAVSDSKIAKTLVLPRTSFGDKHWVSVLNKLGIAVLEYEMDGNSVRFVGHKR